VSLTDSHNLRVQLSIELLPGPLLSCLALGDHRILCTFPARKKRRKKTAREAFVAFTHHCQDNKPKVLNESVTMPAHRKTAKPIMQQGPSTAQKQIAKKRGEAF
jgi:hypothetical protein